MSLQTINTISVKTSMLLALKVSIPQLWSDHHAFSGITTHSLGSPHILWDHHTFSGSLHRWRSISGFNIGSVTGNPPNIIFRKYFRLYSMHYINNVITFGKKQKMNFLLES